MDWKQIETKWAAMALRICADAHSGEINASVRSERSAGKGETTRNVVAKQVAAKQVLAKQIAVVGSESTQELNTVSTR